MIKPAITLTWTGESGYALPASQVTYVSSSQLTISIRLGAAADTWTVKVTNPDGQPSTPFTFTVTYTPPDKWQTITFNQPANKTYGGAPFTLIASASSGLPVIFTIVSGPATLSGSGTLALTGAGTVVLRATQPGDAGWLAAKPVERSFIVAKAPLAAKADDKTKVQGAVNPVLTITYTGFVNAENASVLDTAPTASTSATTSSPIGEYPITLSEGADNNYDLSLQNGTLTVVSDGGSPTVTIIQNNVPVDNLSGAEDSERLFKFTVPAGQTRVEISIGGGIGDCDLYVKLGTPPTTTSFDYASFLGGNDETVTVNSPAAGEWYIMLHGFTDYSNVTLEAISEGIQPLENNVPVSDLTGTQGSERLFKFTVPAGQTRVEISIGGGTGDCDLYVKFGTPPTTSSYDYRPWLGGTMRR